MGMKTIKRGSCLLLSLMILLGNLPMTSYATEVIIAENELSEEDQLVSVPTGVNMTAVGLKILSKTPHYVSPGVSYDNLIMKNADNQQNMGILTKADLQQNVLIKAEYAGYYSANSVAQTRAANAAQLPWGRQTPTAVADAYASIADAEGVVVMATSADYFDTNTGEPRGCLIMEGNVIKKNNRPFFAILKDGTAVIRDAGSDHSDVMEAVSGPYYLVKNGENVAPDNPGLEPRNSVGMLQWLIPAIPRRVMPCGGSMQATESALVDLLSTA